MAAYLHTKSIRPDGSSDCHLTRKVESRERPLWWHKRGFTFTASGYGSRIPTLHMIRVDGRWRRVYACMHSNIGTLFIGDKLDGSAIVTFTDD